MITKHIWTGLCFNWVVNFPWKILDLYITSQKSDRYRTKRHQERIHLLRLFASHMRLFHQVPGWSIIAKSYCLDCFTYETISPNMWLMQRWCQSKDLSFNSKVTVYLITHIQTCIILDWLAYFCWILNCVFVHFQQFKQSFCASFYNSLWNWKCRRFWLISACISLQSLLKHIKAVIQVCVTYLERMSMSVFCFFYFNKAILHFRTF